MPRFGNIGKQYFDDAGDPLVNGKLWFYEAGTTTPKITYKDVNLVIANTNPVILSASGRQPNVFFDGSARVILTDKDDFQIEVRDPEGVALVSNFDNWNPDVNYAKGRIVIYTDGNYYRSFSDVNLNNIPDETPDKWEQIRVLQVWNSTVSYTTNSIVIGSDGFIYRAVQASTNQNPVSTVGFWSFTTTSGTGGATEITSSTNVSLSPTDTRVQSITTTADNLDVSLPNATTMSEGAPTFVLENPGNNTYHIKNNSGDYLISNVANNSITFSLKDNSTADGEWVMSSAKRTLHLKPGASDTINATASGPLCLDRLSDTKSICAYATSTNLFVVVLDDDGTSGAPLDIGAINIAAVRVGSTSATSAVVVYSDSTGVTKGFVVTVSGLVPTAGVEITIDATAGGNGLSLSAIDASDLVCCYTDALPSQVNCVVLTASGLVLSAGTSAVVTTFSADTPQDVVALSDTRAMVVYSRATNMDVVSKMIDISSTPAGLGSEFIVFDNPDSATEQNPRATHLTSDFILISYAITSRERIYLHLIDASGSTPAEIDAASIAIRKPIVDCVTSVAVVSSTRVVVSYCADRVGLFAFTVDIDSDNKIVVSEHRPLLIDSGADNTGYYHDVTNLTSRKAITAYIGSNTFVNSKIIDVYS